LAEVCPRPSQARTDPGVSGAAAQGYRHGPFGQF
jgi:hypothetical protein